MNTAYMVCVQYCVFNVLHALHACVHETSYLQSSKVIDRPEGGGPSPLWMSIFVLDSCLIWTWTDAGDDFVLDLVSTGCGADLVLASGT